MSPITFLSIIPLIASLLKTANGHGMMLDPPNRSSMWHYGFNVPPNYNENGLNCGGFTVIRIFNSFKFSCFFMLIYVFNRYSTTESIKDVAVSAETSGV